MARRIAPTPARSTMATNTHLRYSCSTDRRGPSCSPGLRSHQSVHSQALLALEATADPFALGTVLAVDADGPASVRHLSLPDPNGTTVVAVVAGMAVWIATSSSEVVTCRIREC